MFILCGKIILYFYDYIKKYSNKYSVGHNRVIFLNFYGVPKGRVILFSEWMWTQTHSEINLPNDNKTSIKNRFCVPLITVAYYVSETAQKAQVIKAQCNQPPCFALYLQPTTTVTFKFTSSHLRLMPCFYSILSYSVLFCYTLLLMHSIYTFYFVYNNKLGFC